jgi:hypothetical protein
MNHTSTPSTAVTRRWQHFMIEQLGFPTTETAAAATTLAEAKWAAASGLDTAQVHALHQQIQQAFPGLDLTDRWRLMKLLTDTAGPDVPDLPTALDLLDTEFGQVSHPEGALRRLGQLVAAGVGIDATLPIYTGWLRQIGKPVTPDTVLAIAGPSVHGTYASITEVNDLYTLCGQNWTRTTRFLHAGISTNPTHERGLPRYQQTLAHHGIEARDQLITRLADPDTGYLSADDLAACLPQLALILGNNPVDLIAAAKKLRLQGVTPDPGDHDHGLASHLAQLTGTGMTRHQALSTLLHDDMHSVTAADWTQASDTLTPPDRIGQHRTGSGPGPPRRRSHRRPDQRLRRPAAPAVHRHQRHPRRHPDAHRLERHPLPTPATG